MRFLVDENLPLALTHWLGARGFEAEHTSALGLNATPDHAIARHAVATGATVVTKDGDYLTLARSMPDLRVIHMRAGNLTSAALLALCERAWPSVIMALESGERAISLTSEFRGAR